MSVNLRDIARFKNRKKSRWGPEGERAPVVASIHAIPNIIPDGITIEQLEALMCRVRIEELTRKINMSELDLDYTAERSPSPEPIYDMQGKRINTREQRAKDKLIQERQKLIELATAMDPRFKPPSDYTPVQTKKLRKITIPQERFPEYNFIGLIIGPRGNTQKRMERETGCKISIRGKGSAKDGKVREKSADDNEPLHVLLTADHESSLEKASRMIHALLTPVEEGKNEHKRQQLRELAEINGTLRDKLWMHPDEGRTWEPAQVKCAICGEVSHPTSDCPFKETGLPPEKQAQMEDEYEKFLNEIGETPGGSVPPPPPKAADPYDEFMASIKSETGAADAPWANQASAAPAPWMQQSSQPAAPAPWQTAAATPGAAPGAVPGAVPGAAQVPGAVPGWPGGYPGMPGMMYPGYPYPGYNYPPQ